MLKAKTKVHVIPHTHWDREWYFTTSRSKIYLAKQVKEVLETLENNEDFKYYLLDAQASLLDDYFKWYPEDRGRLEALIASKRIMTGPWYTQTDQLVISGESIVRNLYYGQSIAESFGHSMAVGYVPDAFGQAAQMPQIYKQFGIDTFLFWRGVADNRLKQTEFTWKGSDGSEVFAVQIPFGYYYGGNIPEGEDDILPYLNEQVGKLEAKASTEHVYFPNGFDQAPIRKNLPELINRFNEIDEDREYVLNEPERFLQEIKEAATSLPVLEGELTEGKHSRIHKTIFSTRADLKQLNNQIENFITNTLEPVLTISHSLGHDYPHETVAEIWKLMFENAAHDSIGGCNSDTTNQDVFFRYKQARDLGDNLLELHMRMIAQKINQEETFSFTVFNALPYARKGYVEFDAYLPEKEFTIRDVNGEQLPFTIKEKTELTDYVLNQHIYLNPSKKVYLPEKVYAAKLVVKVNDIPSLGYSQFYFDLKENELGDQPNEKVDAIENDHYRIQFEDDCTLTITHKPTGSVYKNQMIFEENGDDGDSYNYSPPRKDLIISSVGADGTVDVGRNAVEEIMNINLLMEVPRDLEERADGKCSVDMPLSVTVALRSGDPLIHFNVDLDNQALSHRLRVVFATDIASRFSYADQPFGIIKRPVALPELDVWEEEEWQEKPISIEPMQSFVNLHDEGHGFTVFTEGVREYEIIGEHYDTIALTLFRTFGYMGKEDLLYRPGRASGEKIIETPDAQMIGELKFTFAYQMNTGYFDDAELVRTAKEYLSPLAVYQLADFLNGRLIFSNRDEEAKFEKEYSLFEVSPDHTAAVSAIKKAERSDAYILRCFNPYETSKSTVDVKNRTLEAVALNETTAMENITDLSHCQLQTYVIK